VGVAKKETIMKMLTIVCREKFKEEMLVLFGTLGIKGYTVMSGAGGSGETGTVSGTHGWTDRNMLFLVALDNDPMARLVNAVKKLHADLVTEHGGHEVALKVFLQPCEVIL
jgi:nitrogen regulatory protein P-II